MNISPLMSWPTQRLWLRFARDCLCKVICLNVLVFLVLAFKLFKLNIQPLLLLWTFTSSTSSLRRLEIILKILLFWSRKWVFYKPQVYITRVRFKKEKKKIIFWHSMPLARNFRQSKILLDLPQVRTETLPPIHINSSQRDCQRMWCPPLIGCSGSR